MASIYTYWLYDLATNQPTASLPLKAVTFGSKLNDIGGFAGTLALNDPGVQQLQPKSTIQLSRSALYVDRDGALVWGGIIWTRKYQSSDRTLDIAGNDFLSYLRHRFLSSTKAYVAQTPQAIIQDLVAWSKLAAGGDIGLVVNVIGSSPQLVTQTWSPWDLKGIAEAITQLSATAPGFDVAVDVAWVAGVPTKTLTLSYPRRGRVAGSTGLVWEYPPGNVVDYEWSEDGTLMAGTVYEVGSGQGATMLMASGSTPGLIDAGYPLLEAGQSRKDVTDPTLLASFATADAAAVSAPVALPVLTVRGDITPTVGSYTVGDDFRLRVTDPWFPAPAAGGAGFDGYLRIIQIDTTPQDTQGETILLTVGAVPQ